MPTLGASVRGLHRRIRPCDFAPFLVRIAISPLKTTRLVLGDLLSTFCATQTNPQRRPGDDPEKSEAAGRQAFMRGMQVLRDQLCRGSISTGPSSDAPIGPHSRSVATCSNSTCTSPAGCKSQKDPRVAST